MPILGEPVPVPTNPAHARFGLREEALRGVDADVRAAQWSAAFDEFFASINYRRITRPIVSLQDDGAIAFIVRMGDAMALGWSRGFKPSAGQDEWLKVEIDRIEKKLDRLQDGTWRPVFTDSTPSADGEPMGPLGGTDERSDTWATGAGSSWFDFERRRCL